MKRLYRRWDRGRSGFTLLDLIAAIFLIAIVSAIVLPMVFRTRTGHGGANRVKCAANLKTIGQALLLYANENKQAYPRTVFVDAAPLVFSSDASDGGRARDPFGANGAPGQVAANDVTAAIFLLIRTQDITPEVFTCPSGTAAKDTYGTAVGANAQNKTSFTDWRKNLAYSLANPYADAAAVENGWKWDSSLAAEFAVAADMNPGVGDGYDVTLPTSSSPPKEMQKANSRNHGGAGQNVLSGDGHVEFWQTPFAGVKGDNIYTVSGSFKLDDGGPTTSKTVAGSPKGGHDSVLLPAWK